MHLICQVRLRVANSKCCRYICKNIQPSWPAGLWNRCLQSNMFTDVERNPGAPSHYHWLHLARSKGRLDQLLSILSLNVTFIILNNLHVMFLTIGGVCLKAKLLKAFEN